jgi:REP element-mobilizing transposase RayT
VKACALGFMWLDMKKFSPNLRVTRAQFGTIMSRLLWWKKYAWGTPYYRKHLNALKLHNIMTQIQNPEGRVELRQWVWLMLMRAGEEK